MNPEKPRILFLFSDTGGGHRSATDAIIEAIHLEYGNRIDTKMVDFLKEYSPWPFHHLPELYPYMVKYPHIWEMNYLLSNGQYRVKWINRFGWLVGQRPFERILSENPSDLVVSVHAIANDPLYRICRTLNKPFFVVVTDMVTTHAFWNHPHADLTIVPTMAAKERAVANGVPPEKIEVVGLPVANRFTVRDRTPEEMRRNLGWPLDRPVVLMVGGGEGMGPLEEIADVIGASGLKVALAVIAGRNKSLKQRLKKKEWQAPAFIYGFVHEMPDFMQAADILITKAGPGTINEALNATLPMIIYSYLPGQETGNVKFVEENGAGVYASSPDEIVTVIQSWLDHPELLEEATKACEAIANPQASRQIARLLAEAVGVQ